MSVKHPNTICHHWQRAFASLLLFCTAILTIGCAEQLIRNKPASLPSEKTTRRDQLVVHSNFKLPVRHRLLDELASRRRDIANLFQIPLSDEPIHIYLFEDQGRFESFISDKHPNFPKRRAFFVKTDTELNVYAYWGERVGEDLRHEVTHGYLHGSIPNIPLWLDEGAAEFFETQRGSAGFNKSHIYTLANAYRRGDWTPDLTALEAMTPNDVMNQLQYAECWLWFHFLVHSEYETRPVLKAYIERLKLNDSIDPLHHELQKILGDRDQKVIAHLRMLAEKM